MIKPSNYLAHLPIEDRMAELQRLTQSTFCTEAGAIVLDAILEDLGYWREAETPDQVALKNFATHFVHTRLGVKSGLSATAALLNTLTGGT